MGLLSGITKTITDTAKDTVGTIGSFIPGIGDAAAAKEANAAAAVQADKAMAFSERMSNTAYQRASQDMLKAGINPILAYANPASAPSGVAAPVQSETRSRLGSFIADNALGARNAASTAQNANTQAQVGESTVALNKASTAKQVADTQKSMAEAERTKIETQLRRKDLPRADLEYNLMKQASQPAQKIVNSIFDTIGTSAKQYSEVKSQMAPSKLLNNLLHLTGAHHSQKEIRSPNYKAHQLNNLIDKYYENRGGVPAHLKQRTR